MTRHTRIEICKAATFEAAHHLPEAALREGEPLGNARLHGHSFRVEVCVCGPVDAHGRVLGTDALAAALAAVTAQLDHRLLNDVAGLESPTLENLCQWVRRAVQPHIDRHVSRIIVSRPSMNERCVLQIASDDP